MRESALERGNDTDIQIRCSIATKKAFKRTLADLDPDLSYEEFLHVVVRVYEQNPRLFERMHQFGR